VKLVPVPILYFSIEMKFTFAVTLLALVATVVGSQCCCNAGADQVVGAKGVLHPNPPPMCIVSVESTAHSTNKAVSC
jgi:hypothetical protein